MWHHQQVKNRAVFALGLLFLSLASTVQASTVPQLVPKILATYPHDKQAFTQGLVFHQGDLYESTGLYGRSSLRKVELTTGKVLQQQALDDNAFGEGLALVDQQLIQLTWQQGRAFVYDLDRFIVKNVHSYQGQGWGLCFDGQDLWMSDGSATLYRRDAQSFALLEQIVVKLAEQPQAQLNDLACVGEHIYANIWKEPRLVKINKYSGNIAAEIDASELVARSGRPRDGEAVLNGITYDEHTKAFYVTGKLWPKLFKVIWQERQP